MQLVVWDWLGERDCDGVALVVGVCVCEPVPDELRVPESLGDCDTLGVCVELDVNVCEPLMDCVSERVWVCVSLGETVTLGV